MHSFCLVQPFWNSRNTRIIVVLHLEWSVCYLEQTTLSTSLLGLVVYWKCRSDQNSVCFVPTTNHTCRVVPSKWLDILIIIISFIGSAHKLCSMPKTPGRGPFLHHMARELRQTWYNSPILYSGMRFGLLKRLIWNDYSGMMGIGKQMHPYGRSWFATSGHGL